MKNIKKADMKKIKMIVCDLDGTLFNHQKNITKNTIDYLVNLQQNGYILVLATGRFYYELEPFIQKLQMKKFNGYIVCCNGLTVYELASNKIHKFDYLEREDINELIKIAYSFKLNIRTNYNNSYQNIVTRCLYYISPIITKVLTKRYPNLLFYRYNDAIDWQQVGKLCFIARPGKLNKFVKHLSLQYSQRYQIYYTSPFCVEIVRQNVNKAYAINYICQKLSLSFDNVLAFGDGGNDELLLSKAKIGITMKNALPKTLNKAKYISNKTNNQEGVLDCLKELFDTNLKV